MQSIVPLVYVLCACPAGHLFVALKLGIVPDARWHDRQGSSMTSVLLGELEADATDGILIWSGISIRAQPGRYNLTLTAADDATQAYIERIGVSSQHLPCCIHIYVSTHDLTLAQYLSSV